MNVWAFAKVDDDDARKLVYESIKEGKSRFGWSGEPIPTCERNGIASRRFSSALGKMTGLCTSICVSGASVLQFE